MDHSNQNPSFSSMGFEDIENRVFRNVWFYIPYIHLHHSFSLQTNLNNEFISIVNKIFIALLKKE